MDIIVSIYDNFYSDLPVTMWAKFFAEYIRKHRWIKNTLHYVKDVSQNEDKSRIRTWNQPQNISILKNIWLNLFRDYWYKYCSNNETGV
jgi:predicted transposase YbfD/YdcC